MKAEVNVLAAAGLEGVEFSFEQDILQTPQW
jgi:hypothetical protein